MDANKYHQLVWDYELPKDQFFAILNGEKKIGSFDQNWAIVRVLENLNYYEALNLVPIDLLKKHWLKVKPKIFNRSIREGYEFVLRRHTLSAAR